MFVKDEYSLTTYSYTHGFPELGSAVSNLTQLILLAVLVLVLAVGTAIVFSYRKADRRGRAS